MRFSSVVANVLLSWTKPAQVLSTSIPLEIAYLVALLSICSCQRNYEKSTPTEQVDKEAIHLAEKYAQDKKGWKVGEFKVVLKGRKGNFIVLNLNHKDDERSVNVGGGKSVQIWVHVKEMRVVRELAFQ